VRCNFCHVRNDSTKTWDFASDDNKHKLVAREMMTMTNQLNDKYFDMTGGKRDINTKLMVTCYTCHHGKTDPETVAPNPPRQQRAPGDSLRQQRPPGDSTRRN
jgi:galactose-1-phosphate uridylyltransferase